MSGETEENISGWTTDTLKQHVLQIMNERDLRYQQRFESQESNLLTAITAQEKAVSAALSAAERAVNKAEIAAEKRFDSVNEFRGQLADQARSFMPRSESDLQFSAISGRLDSLQKLSTFSGGHTAGLSDGWKYLLGAITLIATVLAIVATVIAVTRAH